MELCGCRWGWLAAMGKPQGCPFGGTCFAGRPFEESLGRRPHESRLYLVDGRKLLENWRRDMEKRLRLSPVHIRKSSSQVGEFLDFCNGRAISRKLALDWLASLAHLSPKTVRNKRSSLKAFGDFLLDQGVAEENPFLNIRTAKSTPSRGSDPFTIDEVRLVVAAAERAEARGDGRSKKFGPLRSTLYLFMVETGLRFSECSRQEWRDIDLDGGVMAVTKDKAGRRDSIPLSASCVDILRTWRTWSKGRQLFPTMPSHHTLKKDMVAAGLEPSAGQWHRFRKTAITERARRGASLRDLHKFARHADASVTERSYDFAKVDELRHAAELLPELASKLKKSGGKSEGSGVGLPKERSDTAGAGSQDPAPGREPPSQWSRGDSTSGSDSPDFSRVLDALAAAMEAAACVLRERKESRHEDQGPPPLQLRPCAGQDRDRHRPPRG